MVSHAQSKRPVGNPGWLRALSCLALALLLVSPPARANVQNGATIVEVRVEQEGQAVTDPVILGLLETTVGEPLSMREVRETITHLTSLNRFDDVQVSQESLANGVRLRYVLVPLHPIDRVEFSGRLGLSEDDLRQTITERYGVAPSAARRDEAVETLRAEYRRRGYPDARVIARVQETHNPDRATLMFDVDAGQRGTIIGLRFTQIDASEQTTIASVPAIKEGQPYDAETIERELRRWEDNLKKRGYYEARASHSSSFAEGGAFVFVNLVRGLHVTVAFAGDPLPEKERERLVPVRAEGSADEDLLEDASRAIEDYLYARGYRDAAVRYARDETASELTITFTIKRGPRYTVRAVNLVGNSLIPRVELEPLLRLEAGKPFVRSELAIGTGAVQSVYRSRGFTRVTVKADESVAAPEDASDPERRVDVTLNIAEGPRAVVRSVAFQGNTSLTAAELAELTALKVGQPYSEIAVVTDHDRIDLEYRNRGYEAVVVRTEPVMAENDTQVDLRYSISEGPRSIVDRIIIVGNQRISTRTIERELLLRPGEPLGFSDLVESRARLAALGLFRRIQVEPVAHTGESRQDVIVRVEESPPTTFGVGGGLEGGFRLRTGADGQAEEHFEVAPRGFVEIGRRNLWGKNRALNLFTRVSPRARDLGVQDTPAPLIEDSPSERFIEYRVLTNYREPRVFNSRADMLVTGILEQAVRSSFNFSRREIRAQTGGRLSSIYSFDGIYSFQRTELFDEKFTEEDAPLIDRLFPQVRLSKVTGSIIRSTRDDALDPSRGTLFIVTGDLAARGLGSEVGFIKTYVQGFSYYRLPTNRRTILALGARVGAAHGFAREVDGLIVQDLPASERFFAGGDTTVRGFSLDRLGNEDTITPNGFPTGGNSVIVLNSELRVTVLGPVQAVGFVDAGNVFPLASDLDFTDLRPAAGFGLLYRSPVGPVRVDMGFNLDRKELVPGTLERGNVLHILLGQAF